MGILKSIQRLSARIEKKKLPDSLEPILTDPVGFRGFLLFAKSEFAVENVLAWECARQYWMRPTWDRLQLFSDVFLRGTESPLELNVPKVDAKKVTGITKFEFSFFGGKQESQSGSTSSKGGPDKQSARAATLLVDVLKNITINLSDTMSRYVFHHYYLYYQQRYLKEKAMPFSRVDLALTAVAAPLVALFDVQYDREALALREIRHTLKQEGHDADHLPQEFSAPIDWDSSTEAAIRHLAGDSMRWNERERAINAAFDTTAFGYVPGSIKTPLERMVFKNP